jgi:hypothetical protein
MQLALHDLARVNRCAVDGALKHFLIADQAIAPVDEDHGEDFSLERSKLKVK